MVGEGANMSTYREFEIETFQLGRDQWHACFRPIDRSKPIVIDGIALGVVNLGFAWPTPDAALKEAQRYIERMASRRVASA
jgi:hypothetical protein